MNLILLMYSNFLIIAWMYIQNLCFRFLLIMCSHFVYSKHKKILMKANCMQSLVHNQMDMSQMKLALYPL